MRTIKIFLYLAIVSLLFSCSQKKMDYVNQDRNDALDMPSKTIIPDIELKTAFEVAGTDIAWYATVYIEQSAGTWAQSASADKRVAQNDASLFNNNWVSIYDVINECKAVLKKTEPSGTEPDNYWARGIAFTMEAYNLAYATDMWGEAPWTEACLGAANLQPKFDKQSFIYPQIQMLLDSAISNLGKTTIKYGAFDYIYGGDQNLWIKAAWSLKARYWMRLTDRDTQAAANALACIANGLGSNDDNFLFNKYEASATGENPWYQFLNDRTHLSSGQTLYDLMNDRNDPRIPAYFTQVDTSSDPNVVKLAYMPAPNGTAIETQGGIYSTSLITQDGQTAATPLMTYHELKFIEAEAKFRTGDATWQTSLQDAITANFTFHGVADDPVAYFTTSVLPRLTSGNELNEIITQKYISFYEFEAVEAYNDYRRVGIPTMHNPNNLTATGGFVNRFPFAISEVSSNSAHVPKINVFVNKVWWAGGDELGK
jgi:hypothetical protein